MEIEFKFENSNIKHGKLRYKKHGNKKEIEKAINLFRKKEKPIYRLIEKITKRKLPKTKVKCYIYGQDKKEKEFGGIFVEKSLTPKMIIKTNSKKDFLTILMHEIAHIYLRDLNSIFHKKDDYLLEILVNLISTKVMYDVFKVKNFLPCRNKWWE